MPTKKITLIDSSMSYEHNKSVLEFAANRVFAILVLLERFFSTKYSSLFFFSQVFVQTNLPLLHQHLFKHLFTFVH